MIYKVLYQKHPEEVPVRERTEKLYIEAESERDVRQKLNDRNYNIEFVQPLDAAHLAYEKQSEDFALETV